MGWTSSSQWSSKTDLVNNLLATQFAPFAVTKHALRGNVLYVLANKPSESSMIFVVLLEKHGGDWSYKDMSESMGPCYYTCPLGFFDLAPVAGAYGQAWRDKTRAHAAKVAARARMKLAPGMRVTLIQGLTIGGVALTEATVVTVSPLVVDTALGQTRLKRTYIVSVSEKR